MPSVRLVGDSQKGTASVAALKQFVEQVGRLKTTVHHLTRLKDAIQHRYACLSVRVYSAHSFVRRVRLIDERTRKQSEALAEIAAVVSAQQQQSDTIAANLSDTRAKLQELNDRYTYGPPFATFAVCDDSFS